MLRMKSLSMGLMAVAVSIVLVAPNMLTAGDASRYPQDDT